MDKINLLNDNSIEVMETYRHIGMKVDAVITDIPYGVTKNSIDIMPDLAYLFELVFSITDTFITTCQGKALQGLMQNMPKNIKWHDIIWDKVNPTGFLNAKRQPLRSHETILVMYKKQPTYNPQLKKGKPLHGRGTAYLEKDEQINNNYGEFDHKHDRDTPIDMKYPKSVWVHKKPHPSVALHPTAKPVSLYDELVRTYTNEGDIVLDPFMGSGTTGVACRKNNRYFIGIELGTDIFNKAKDRIGGDNNG